MPLYEYRCEACGRQSEVLQRHGEPPLETCAECGGKLRKLFSAPAFQFKGSGWYVTDYARSGGPAGGEKSGKAASSTADGSSAPADGAGAETSGSEAKKSQETPSQGAAAPKAATTPATSGAKE